MNEKFEKMKETIKRNAPVIIATATLTTLAIITYQQKKDKGWTAYVLNQEQRDELARNADAVVLFKNEKVLILGQTWNPDK